MPATTPTPSLVLSVKRLSYRACTSRRRRTKSRADTIPSVDGVLEESGFAPGSPASIRLRIRYSRRNVVRVPPAYRPRTWKNHFVGSYGSAARYGFLQS